MSENSGATARNKIGRVAVVLSSIALVAVIVLFYLPVSLQCRCGLIPESKPTDETKVLIAVLEELLSNTDGSSDHLDFYGTPGEKMISLVDDKLPWPKCFPDEISGYQIVRTNHPLQYIYWQSPRLVGVRIDRLDLSMNPPEDDFSFFENAPVVITIYNVGGSPDGVIHMGGSTFCYSLSREDGKWVVKPTFSFS